MKYAGKDVGFFLVDGFNLLASKLDTLDVPAPEAITEESHGLGDQWRETTPVGLRKAMASQIGLYDDAADSVNAALRDAEETSRIAVWNIEGNTIGKKYTAAAGAFFHKYCRLFTRGGLHK